MITYPSYKHKPNKVISFFKLGRIIYNPVRIDTQYFTIPVEEFSGTFRIIDSLKDVSTSIAFPAEISLYSNDSLNREVYRSTINSLGEIDLLNLKPMTYRAIFDDGNSLPWLTRLTVHEDGSHEFIKHPSAEVKGNGYLSGSFPLSLIEGSPEPPDAITRAVVKSDNPAIEGYIAGTATVEPNGHWVIEGLNENFLYDVIAEIPGYNGVIISNVSPDPDYDPPVIEPVDPYWDNVVALLHFDGDLVDESQTSVFTAVNDISFVPTAFSKGGFFTGNNYLMAPHSENYNLGNIFTIELIASIVGAVSTISPKIAILVGKNSKVPANDWELGYRVVSDNTYSLVSYDKPAGGVSLDSETNNKTFPMGIPAHIAITSDGVMQRLFHNGQLVASAPYVAGGWVSSSGTLLIGAFQYNQYHHQVQGVIDELRITKGVARYTENFIPPATPFPNRGP